MSLNMCFTAICWFFSITVYAYDYLHLSLVLYQPRQKSSMVNPNIVSLGIIQRWPPDARNLTPKAKN